MKRRRRDEGATLSWRNRTSASENSGWKHQNKNQKNQNHTSQSTLAVRQHSLPGERSTPASWARRAPRRNCRRGRRKTV
eukprot:2821549-Rhodomonas_salina.1